MSKYVCSNILSPLVNAFKNGDIYEFERIHDSQRILWARLGCYWIMKQRVEALLHRNLFKKVYGSHWIEDRGFIILLNIYKFSHYQT